MNLNINERLAVRVLYPCHICGQLYTKGPNTIEHIQRMHGQTLPKRPTGRNRPPNQEYIYVGVYGDKWDAIHHGCSCCWYHTVNMKELQNHVNNEHVEKNLAVEEGSSNENSIEEGSTNKGSTDESSDNGNEPTYDKRVARNLVQQVLKVAGVLARILKV